MKTKILFVCLGNICRSPAAEAITKKIVERKGLSHLYEIDSAGILPYHKGEMPDERMQKYGALRGYTIDSISRPVTAKDFDNFDIIIGMDEQNIADLNKRATSLENAQKIEKIDRFFTKYNYTDIPDPYFGTKKDFDLVIDLLEDACENIIQKREK